MRKLNMTPAEMMIAYNKKLENENNGINVSERGDKISSITSVEVQEKMQNCRNMIYDQFNMCR